MIARLDDDETGHDLLLRGVVHEIELTSLGKLSAHTGSETDHVVLLRVFGGGVEATALLDREDAGALADFLARYRLPEESS